MSRLLDQIKRDLGRYIQPGMEDEAARTAIVAVASALDELPSSPIVEQVYIRLFDIRSGSPQEFREQLRGALYDSLHGILDAESPDEIAGDRPPPVLDNTWANPLTRGYLQTGFAQAPQPPNRICDYPTEATTLNAEAGRYADVVTGARAMPPLYGEAPSATQGLPGVMNIRWVENDYTSTTDDDVDF